VKYYTGIGSRKAPSQILELCEGISSDLATKGYTLRSGAAEGCDTAFEAGCNKVSGESEIYLPWKRFNKHPSKLFSYGKTIEKIAEEVYGARWSQISNGAKRMMTRNVCQIIGQEYIHSDFVICWTPDGCEVAHKRGRQTGGTGQAIELAYYLNIPVFNIKNGGAIESFYKFLNDNN